MGNQQFVRESLTQNLIYIKVFKYFCINIKLAFLEKDKSYSDVADDFYQKFAEISEKLLTYADGRLNETLLKSGTIVTEYTLPTIRLTEKLFDVKLPVDLSVQQLNLNPGEVTFVTEEEIAEILVLDKKFLVICKNFVDFLTNIFKKETNNTLFSYSYPYLIRKMIDEISICISVLERLIKRQNLDPTQAIDHEFRSINLLKGFSMFIRSFIDPSRNDFIIKAQSFIVEFDHLLMQYKNADFSPQAQEDLTEKGYQLVKRFKKFVATIIEELLAGKVYLIIEPIFLDNMYRTINNIIYFTYTPDILIENIEAR